MNRYFLSFQKSRGGRFPPRKIRGGDTSPPRPPPGIAAYGIVPFCTFCRLWHYVSLLSRIVPQRTPHCMGRSKTNVSKWTFADIADTACDECGTSEQTMPCSTGLLRCPLLENECSLEDLATANEKALHRARAWPNQTSARRWWTRKKIVKFVHQPVTSPRT